MSEYSCGIGYMTALPVGDVHDWLEENISGDFHVQLADINDDASYTKKVEIFFENESDRDKFKTLFKEYEKQRKSQNDAAASRGLDGGGSSEKPKGKGFLGMLRPEKK